MRLAIFITTFSNCSWSVRMLSIFTAIMVVVKLASMWSLRLTIIISWCVAAATIASHTTRAASTAHSAHASHASSSLGRALVVVLARFAALVVSVPILPLSAVSSVGSMLSLRVVMISMLRAVFAVPISVPSSRFRFNWIPVFTVMMVSVVVSMMISVSVFTLIMRWFRRPFVILLSSVSVLMGPAV